MDSKDSRGRRIDPPVPAGYEAARTANTIIANDQLKREPQRRSQGRAGVGGACAPPEKGVLKNLKTLKGGTLFVSVILSQQWRRQGERWGRSLPLKKGKFCALNVVPRACWTFGCSLLPSFLQL